MPAGQSSGTGAHTELDDEKVRKDDILSNRDKAQRPPGQGLDGKGAQVDEYKDNPANRRPPKVGDSRDPASPPENTGEPDKDIDRPGLDLGGATGETRAGKGLGLGTDARTGRKDWRLPR
jgi:hypothetical protein